jgi:ABC-type transport system involved in cytochrome c biogenesis permease component
MNPQLAIAGVLAALLAVTHSWLGERWIIQPVLAIENMPPLFGSRRGMKKILRFAWHLTSVFVMGMAAVLLHYSQAAKDVAVLTILAGTYFISAIMTVVVSRGRHYAWIVFLTIGLLTWFART